MGDNEDSVFGPPGFKVFADESRTRQVTGEEASRFEADVRHNEHIAPLWSSTLTPPAFLRRLAERIGKPEARRVVDFVSAWVVASEALGHPATALEYAAHWGVGEATAYRELRAFKAAYPTEKNPERLAWTLGWARTPWIPQAEYNEIVRQLLGTTRARE